MQSLVWAGALVSLVGVAGLVYCVMRALRARRAGLSDEAMRGEFQVFVRHYAAAPDAPNTPIPFIVQLRRGDERQRFDGTAQPGARYKITSFQFD